MRNDTGEACETQSRVLAVSNTGCCPRVVALHLHVRASRAVGPAPSYPILSDPIPSCPVPSPQEGGSARLQAAPAHGWLTASSCSVHLGSNSGLQGPRGGCRVGPREPVAAPRGSAVGTGHDPVLPSHEKRGVLLASAEQQSRVCELAAGLCFCCPESKVMTEFLRKKTDWETEDCSMHLLVSQKAQAQHAPSAASGCMTRVRGYPEEPATTLGGPTPPSSGREFAHQAQLWPEPHHCRGQGILKALGWVWHPNPGQVPGARAVPTSSILQPQPALVTQPLPGRGLSRMAVAGGLTGTGTAQHFLPSASNDGKHRPSGTAAGSRFLLRVSGTARPAPTFANTRLQEAPPKENNTDKPHERATQTQCVHLTAETHVLQTARRSFREQTQSD